jgi:hypothetical protein
VDTLYRADPIDGGPRALGRALIDRRETAAMLYRDHYVCELLERVDHEVRTTMCRYRDVQRLHESRTPLNGVIRQSMPGRDHDLRYNAADRTIPPGSDVPDREASKPGRAGGSPPPSSPLLDVAT